MPPLADSQKQARHQAITQAAYDLLAQKGYGGTSMLAVAKAAKASNQTMYKWYGDKRGLFETMVRDNAAQTGDMLRQALSQQSDPKDALARISPIFLTMLLGERAVLLNRAAAADPSGDLGQALAKGGRDEIQPLFGQLMQAIATGSHHDAQTLTQIYLGLLIGDTQIKRATATMAEPSKAEIIQRCSFALKTFESLI